jgi:hypothetical protein
MASSYVLTRREPIVTFEGRTASASYTMKKGVSPVARLGEVWLPHSAHGSSSIHFLLCFFKPSKVWVLRPFSISALARSTYPLLSG